VTLALPQKAAGMAITAYKRFMSGMGAQESVVPTATGRQKTSVTMALTLMDAGLETGARTRPWEAAQTSHQSSQLNFQNIQGVQDVINLSIKNAMIRSYGATLALRLMGVGMAITVYQR